MVLKSEGDFSTRSDVIRGCDDETVRLFNADPTSSCLEHEIGLDQGPRKKIGAYIKYYQSRSSLGY